MTTATQPQPETVVGKRVIVYVGPCYGAVHTVTEAENRMLHVQPPIGPAFWVSIVDCEEIQQKHQQNHQ